MTSVPEDSFAALQQLWVIVGRIGSEAGFQGQRPNYRADPVESRALNESKTWVPGGKPAQQSDQPRAEECNAHDRAFWKRPTRDDVAPQERENKKVTPNHDFEIVPFPRRRLDEVSQSENGNGG